VHKLIGDIIAASMSLLGEFHLHHYTSVAEKFITKTKFIGIHAFGNVHLDDTCLVTTDINEDEQFVLQSINAHVLKQAKLIMQNRRALTEHMWRGSKDR
jgi:hypothetical protein